MKLTSNIKSVFSRGFKLLSERLYDLKVSAKGGRPVRAARNTLTTQKRADLVFYASFLAVPLFMYVVSNIVINVNSFVLAFQSINPVTGEKAWSLTQNFAAVVDTVLNDPAVRAAAGRSLQMYLITTLVTNIVPIMFSYYIYKKKPFYKFFRVVLYTPSIISGVITATVFKLMANRLVPQVYFNLTGQEIFGLLTNPATQYGTIFFYSLWMSFGTGLLIQVAAMSVVDESVQEYAKLDGLGFLKEFWYIVLPCAYQVLSLGIITGITMFFTGDLGMYAFYGMEANPRVWTLGYYFTSKTVTGAWYDYPFFAAWGLVCSAIVIPIILSLRHVIYKYGPSED